ncbi:MAG TPA: sigma factor-like helix-turn-helix DNA-binding protein [Solirubrobacter sp.]|nr:sigma factor-like helix-turn-helix DNA-binding protein [Solirubrobacter sp.]
MPVTGIDTLAPDQRAAVELVLRQGRSYAELSDMLGMPEETIRARARGGLEALAPDLPAPARSGEIADWLLGQQSERHAARTRELLLSDPEARKWAATVAAPLREVPGGESVPELPSEGRDNGTPAPAASSPVRSSRLGGALLIAGAVAIVAVVLAFVLLRGGDEEEPTANTEPAAATPTPTAVGLQPGDVVMQGPAGSKALAVLRLVPTGQNRIEFALVGQDIPPNKNGERYSLWFRNEDGTAQLIGDIARPVGKNGQLASSGPNEDDIDEFPTWFQTYETAAITLDEPGAKKPGRVIVSGPLPDTSG